MSRYIEDVQGNIASNPINETNTKYGYIIPENGIRNADKYNIDTQYMYNNGEPVSNIDTNVFDEYRDTVEYLRTRTESRLEALQSCLIPTEISGMSFRPYEFRKSEDEYGQEIQEKVESFTYFFQDHMEPISMTSNEFVFRTNKVKFISDRHRRQNYDRRIHILTTKEDEDNRVSFADVIRRTFFVYEDNTYIPRVKDQNSNDLSYDSIINAIYNDITANHYQYTVIDSNGNERLLSSKSDFNLVFKSGQDIDTSIPSTLYNLHNIGWVQASVIFLNGLIIPWNKILLSVDNIDTFIIIYGLGSTLNKLIESGKEVVLDYIHIPFKVEYIVNSITSTTPYYKKYVTNNKLNKQLIFIIDKNNGAVLFNSNTSQDYSLANIGSISVDRIICLDGNIKYGEFALGTDDPELKDIKIEYSKSFKEFCGNDYRCKLKRFNFLGFEFDRYWDNDNTNRATYKNDDFDTTWHPFNIIDIHFDRMYHSRRMVKVFYNTKVLYDQDNALRIKNQDALSQEYERYRHDLTGNMEAYLDEIYAIAKCDIGTYIATSGRMKGYKYTYITPYECMLMYNAYMKVKGGSTVDFEGFRKLNLLNPGYVVLNYLNGGFIATDKDDERFSRMIKESQIFTTSGSVNSEYTVYLRNLINKGCTYLDVIAPIDNELKVNKDVFVPVTNTFEYFEGDTRGKIIPHLPFMDLYDLVQEYDDVVYDKLKIRFEMAYLTNMEEGATPVDEFVYYFDNNGLSHSNTYPVVNTSNLTNRRTAITLYATAKNMFKIDPNKILPYIEKLIYRADYILPTTLGSTVKSDFIITGTDDYSKISGYNYKLDPHFYYNYGYRDASGKPHKYADEYSLRRNLPELFYWSLDSSSYSLTSMGLLDKVFDFTYDLTKSYEDNLKKGTNYIIGYDADKLEQSIKRSVVSMTKTGKELKDHMAKHKCKKDTSVLDGYKLITFVKASNQKVAFDNIIITVTISDTTLSSVTYTPYEGGSSAQFNVVSMKHRSQDHYSISKTNSAFTYVDKSFTQAYTSVKYNNTTEQLEYYNGSELVITLQVDHVIDTSRLEMSRWNISSQENYVMIFKNKLLYERYSDIEYTDTTFSVPFVGTDTDMFEFVFFLNANNTILKKEVDNKDDLKLTVLNSYYSTDTQRTNMTTLNSAIACNTSILEPEYVQLVVDVQPSYIDGGRSDLPSDNTAFKLVHTIKSYEASVATDRNYPRMQYRLLDDTKLNGLHRVTKQGGGEYFLEFDGTVPSNSNTQFGGYETKRYLNVPYNLYLSSNRQFRYKGFTVDSNKDTGYIHILNVPEYDEDIPETYVYKTGIDNFKFCLDENHIMVFKNGLLLPETCYLMHSIITAPITDVGLVFNVPLKKGDRIDIFYVTNNLRHLEVDYYDTDKNERYISNGLIKIASNKKDEVRVMGEEVNASTRTNYIKFRSPLYAISSKHSVFVFLNGKKVRTDELRDISDTIMSIDTDYSTTDKSMNAIRLEVLNHLDTQDIIEQLYINDGLAHTASIVDQYKNNNQGSSNVYKSTFQVKSFKLKDLEAYAKRTLLDDMLNDLSDKNLNKLFYNYSSAIGPTTPYNKSGINDGNFITREDIYKAIFDKYYDTKPLQDFTPYEIVVKDGHTLIYMKDDDDFNIVVCKLDGMISSDQVKTGSDLYNVVRQNNMNLVVTHLDKFVTTSDLSKKDGNDWIHNDSMNDTMQATVKGSVRNIDDDDIIVI